jgi:hypothetical protein
LNIFCKILSGLGSFFPASNSKNSLNVHLNLWINLMGMMCIDRLTDLRGEIIFDIKVAIIPNDSGFSSTHLVMNE